MLQQSDDSYFKEISESNYNKLSSAIQKVGYSDGILAGRDSAFQEGFNQGYSDGLKLGFQTSALQAFAETMSSHTRNLDVNHGLTKEIQKCIGTDVTKDGNNFHSACDRSTSARQMIQLRTAHTDELVSKLQETFPEISSFISNK